MLEYIQFSSVQSLSRVQLFATPWTTAYQAPLSMGFSRQEYWSGVPLPSPYNMLLSLFTYFYVQIPPELDSGNSFKFYHVLKSAILPWGPGSFSGE